MQEQMDSDDEARDDLPQMYSIEHYLMEHPERNGETLYEFDEGYQNWLKEQYLPKKQEPLDEW